MQGSAPREEQGGPERRAGPRIGALEDRRGIVAAGVQTGDGGIVRTQYSGVRVDAQAGAAGEVCGPDGDGIERSGGERAQARIGQIRRVAVEAVQVGTSAAERLVDP